MRQFQLFMIGCFLLAFLHQGCSKKTISKVPAAEYFILGSGGGYTGAYEEYKIFEDGRIDMRGDQSSPFESMSVMSKEESNAVWQELRAMKLKDINLDDPGNFNYYIKLPLKESGFHMIQWNDESLVPDRLSDFHYDTYQLIINEIKL